MSIPFVKDMAFTYGAPRQVSPLIRHVMSANPGPFTFHGTGVYIVGAGEVAVIDPGPDIPGQLDMLRAAVAGETVRAVVVTHHHLDHSPMAHPLAEAIGAPVYGTAAPRPHAANGAPQIEEGEDDGFRPDVLVRDGDVITGPGWTLRAVATPGHTSAHMAYLLEEENALFSGDHVMGWSTTVISPPDGSMAQYYDSLARVQALAPAVIWPTHGPPILEPAPFVSALIAHRRGREAQILAALQGGPATIAEMVPAIYQGLDPRLFPAAGHSMLAHLIWLQAQGAVETADGPPGPTAVFRLRG